MDAFTVTADAAHLRGWAWPARAPVRGTIVALHAGVADSRAWHGCAPAWTDAGWRVVAYDRRGFGDSEWEPEPHDHVADLLAVLDDRGIERAVLLGNSMGGALAVDTALAHPQRVEALVLVGSAVSGEPPVAHVFTEAEQALEAQIDEAEEAGDLDRVNALECHYWLDGPDQPAGRVTGDARERFLAMNGRALHAPDVGEQQRPPDAWSRLGEIAVPTLVVAGALDERMVLAFADRLASDIPGARQLRLDRSAHLPALDATDRFAALVAEFLGGV